MNENDSINQSNSPSNQTTKQLTNQSINQQTHQSIKQMHQPITQPINAQKKNTHLPYSQRGWHETSAIGEPWQHSVTYRSICSHNAQTWRLVRWTFLFSSLEFVEKYPFDSVIFLRYILHVACGGSIIVDWTVVKLFGCCFNVHCKSYETIAGRLFQTITNNSRANNYTILNSTSSRWSTCQKRSYNGSLFCHAFVILAPKTTAVGLNGKTPIQ